MTPTPQDASRVFLWLTLFNATGIFMSLFGEIPPRYLVIWAYWLVASMSLLGLVLYESTSTRPD